MLRAEDIKDDFWSVHRREEAELEGIRSEIRKLEAELQVAQRAEALKHAPGYQDFFKALQQLHASARDQLVGDNRLTDAGLREMRGRVKGVESVLALLTSTTEADVLAKRIEDCKNLLVQAQSRRPKPQGATT